MMTRKELADLISTLRKDKVTVTQLQKNERAWGLVPARRDLNKRVVRYDKARALEALRKREIIPDDDSH